MRVCVCVFAGACGVYTWWKSRKMKLNSRTTQTTSNRQMYTHCTSIVIKQSRHANNCWLFFLFLVFLFISFVSSVCVVLCSVYCLNFFCSFSILYVTIVSLHIVEMFACLFFIIATKPFTGSVLGCQPNVTKQWTFLIKFISISANAFVKIYMCQQCLYTLSVCK